MNNNSLGGILAVHVDDMVCGGTAGFVDTVLKPLEKKYPFKHWKKGGGTFLGRNLQQQQDGSIVCDQSDYASKVQTINISKERRKQKDDALTPKELNQYRGIIGAANWVTGSTRPDIAAWTGLLQQKTGHACVGDLIDANRPVSKIRDMKHVSVTIKSIPLDDGMVVVTSDASWANCSDLSSQAAYMTLFAHKQVAQNQWSDVSPLRWKSWKLERKTQSTLGAELMAVSRAVAEGDWIRSMFAEARQHDYVLTDDKKRRQQLDLMIITDNKPIFDHSQGDGVTIKDKRTAIDMLILKSDLKSERTVLRWVDTRQMTVDSLTKMSASPDFLYFLLKFGKYIVVEEGVSLQWKAQEKIERKLASPSKKGCEKSSTHDG